MTKKYNEEEWNKILNEINDTALSVTSASRIFNVSRNQIHLKLRQRKKSKSFFNKLKAKILNRKI